MLNFGSTSCQADFPVILAAQLLFVFFVLREEFAFLFQTFSRSDPPGKAPLTRGRYVFQKKKKEKKNIKREEGEGGASASAGAGSGPAARAA